VADQAWKKPNILVLITDQQKADTIEDESLCSMPHLAKLRQNGAHFKRAYTSNAICSPARASLMTGLYPSRHGMVDCTHTVEPYRADYKEGLPMWSQQLAEQGYVGGYFGKWHVERSEQPMNFGFGRFVANGSAQYRQYREELGYRGKVFLDKKMVRHEGYKDRIFYGVLDEPQEASEPYFLYDQGIRFVKEMAEAERPWFTVISTLEPHDPFVVSKDYYALYEGKEIQLPENYRDDLSGKPGLYRRLRLVWNDVSDEDVRKATACYYASCSLIDDQIGRIVETLKETGQLENTYIVFTSDHGELLGAHGLFLKGVPAYEEVYRIPLVIAGPDVKPAVYDDVFVSIVDLAPTLCEWTGSAPLPGIDGHSLVPMLRGEPIERESFPWNEAYSEFHGQRFFYTQRLVWHGNYKYIFNGFDEDELYDLNRDPHELNNLTGDPAHAEVLKDMVKRMWRRVYRLGDYNMAHSDYGMFRFAPIGPDFEEHPFKLEGPVAQ